MKTVMKNLILAVSAAAVLFTLPVWAEYGELLARDPCDGSSWAVTDTSVLAGLPTGAHAVLVPTRGSKVLVPMSELTDRPGHPYTIVLKIKPQATNGKICLLNTRATKDSDAMVYLDSSTRKVHIKQFDKSRDSAVSEYGIELNRWTAIAIAFGEEVTEIYIDGNPVYSGRATLAGSFADCYICDALLIGADNDGEDSPFYLADIRIYDGARPAGDELEGFGVDEEPFLITSAADWALLASNINRGITSGLNFPLYRLTADIGTARAPVTQSIGEEGFPFEAEIDGSSHTLHVAISGSETGTAPFVRTDKTYIHDLKVTGSVSSTANYAAGLVGVCDGLTIVENCIVSTAVSVSGATHAGGIIGHGGDNHELKLLNSVFSGGISGFSAHAGGLIGWCGSLKSLQIRNVLFKGSFNGSGRCHPIICRDGDSVVPTNFLAADIYYLNTVMSTEDTANIVSGAEGSPVNTTYVPYEWGESVKAADGIVYYKSSIKVLTATTGDLLLRNGEVLTGTGGPDTHVAVEDGATVILRDVNITAIHNNGDHLWPGITCQGDATFILEGDNAVRSGYEDYPGIFVWPGSTLTIQGDGTLDASSNGYGAGIGGGYGSWLSCGDIVIAGGTITATGGQFAAGIGGGYQATCGTITITGGTVTAIGGEFAPGIGGGYQTACGDIAFEEGITRVIADSGAGALYSIGADQTCTVTVDGVETGNIAVSHYVYNPCILTIATSGDWDAFASRVNTGQDSYGGKTVTLTADVAISTIVGMNGNPFCGIFDGGGHTLTVNISSTEQCAAPFRQINGATIHDLTVAGTVTGSDYHAAGLVGSCGNDHPNTIRNCTVAATVNGNGYAGGIVGHGGHGILTLEGCVFSGAVNGFANFAGGLLGWCDALTLNIANCLSTGTFAPVAGGKYHPVACRFANRTVTATVTGAYYLNTIVPTVLGTNPPVATSNLIPGAEGVPVSATLVDGGWTQPVTAADGNVYYGWTDGPAGRLLAHLSFDDYGNGGLNLLRAGVGQDAIVRATQTVPVEGIGEIAAVSEADILSGLAEGDGAAAIPKGQYFAVPTPAALLSAHGRPYTIVMKIRVPNTVGWRSLLNMPASNDTDEMIYLQQTTRNVYLKQFDKTSGAGIAASSGNVEADRWTTLAFAFGENTTDIYRDGTLILHTDGALAGSYADCASAGGYFLVGADDNGDDDLFYLSDFRVYEGAVAVSKLIPGSGTSQDPYIITSTEDWDTFAANVNAGIDAAACYRLAADIDVTTTVGTSAHPFCGVFDGGGHTLTANLSGTDYFVAPFSAISGATISNLVVAGTVAGYMHCSGLVGTIVHGVNVIENCKVAAAITSSASHFGGFIGHSITNAVTLRGCVFSGSLSGGTYVATFHGWSDDGAATTLIDCLDVSASTQPIGRGHDAACVSNTYYFASKNFSNRERLWSEGMRGKRACAVTAGEGIAIDLGAPTAAYGTSGVTAYATGLAFGDNFYAASGETVSLGVAYTGVPPSGTILDGFAVSAGDLARDGDGWCLTMPDTNVAISAVFRAATGYGIWAAANGITGAWDATDASGIPNVFRYAFNKPTGDFALLGIAFNGDGKVVIVTPPLVNGEGVALSIVASDNVDGGGGVATTPLDPSGETVINETGKKKRFFRLRATKQ